MIWHARKSRQVFNSVPPTECALGRYSHTMLPELTSALKLDLRRWPPGDVNARLRGQDLPAVPTQARNFRRRHYRTVKGNIRAIKGQIQRVETALTNAELWVCQLQSYGEMK